MHAVVILVIVVHTPCGTIHEDNVSKQHCYAEVHQIVIVLKRLFQIRIIIPTLEIKIRDTSGDSRIAFLHCGDILDCDSKRLCCHGRLLLPLEPAVLYITSGWMSPARGPSGRVWGWAGGMCLQLWQLA